MPNIVNRIYNPITGIFGSGNVAMWVGSTAATGVAQTSQTITWTIPPGVGAVRVRLWGGGGYTGGGGGAFALKTINDLSGLTSVTILVGFGANDTTTTGGTSSFGSFVSATGGVNGGAGGTATGGDINFSGGAGNGAGGGAASVFGPGGLNGSNSFPGAPSFGGAGGGFNTTLASSGSGSLIASGGSQTVGSVTTQLMQQPASGLSQFSIDFIGCGGGPVFTGNGINGSGSGRTVASGVTGGIPGGGGISGGAGMVIVEW